MLNCECFLLLRFEHLFWVFKKSLRGFYIYFGREFNAEANRNCLGRFRGISWMQTSDVHRGSTLITWRWRYITWRCRHRNHANTITSAIVKCMCFLSINAMAIFYWKIHKLHLFCLLNFFGKSETWILIGLNQHATELIFLCQFRLTKWNFFLHSTTRNAPYVHPMLDWILELYRTFAIDVEACHTIMRIGTALPRTKYGTEWR